MSTANGNGPFEALIPEHLGRFTTGMWRCPATTSELFGSTAEETTSTLAAQDFPSMADEHQFPWNEDVLHLRCRNVALHRIPEIWRTSAIPLIPSNRQSEGFRYQG